MERIADMDRANGNIYIGKRIRRARQIAGWSQMQLAKRCGLAQDQISRYETGTLTISAYSLIKIARVTGQPLDFFDGMPGTTEPELVANFKRGPVAHNDVTIDDLTSLINEIESYLVGEPGGIRTHDTRIKSPVRNTSELANLIHKQS